MERRISKSATLTLLGFLKVFNPRRDGRLIAIAGRFLHRKYAMVSECAKRQCYGRCQKCEERIAVISANVIGYVIFRVYANYKRSSGFSARKSAGMFQRRSNVFPYFWGAARFGLRENNMHLARRISGEKRAHRHGVARCGAA